MFYAIDGDLSATGMYDKTGAMIVEVPIFGKAPDFGFTKGDVILQINDTKVKNADFFVNQKTNPFENGTEIKSIIVWRNQERVVLK